MTRIQDEAHRFAIEYHRSLRAKGQVHSVLDDIKGVGPKRRKELMKYFKDLGQIKTATVTELLNVHESKYCRVYLWVFSRFQAVRKYVKIEKRSRQSRVQDY